MPQPCDDEHSIAEQVGIRHGMSTGAVQALLDALKSGYGSMAQFNHPELGGLGQWSKGGMVMVGSMNDHGLKARIDAVCMELSDRLMGAAESSARQMQDFSHQEQVQGYGHGGSGASRSVEADDARGRWWRVELGQPSATGAQNGVRYANFADRQRLAIEAGGCVTVYDTASHHLTGFSQEQSSGASVSFTGHDGPVRVVDLPIVPPTGADPPRPTENPLHSTLPAPAPGVLSDKPSDVLATIERLGEMQRKGILTESEFAAKKQELLDRLGKR